MDPPSQLPGLDAGLQPPACETAPGAVPAPSLGWFAAAAVVSSHTERPGHQNSQRLECGAGQVRQGLPGHVAPPKFPDCEWVAPGKSLGYVVGGFSSSYF